MSLSEYLEKQRQTAVGDVAVNSAAITEPGGDSAVLHSPPTVSQAADKPAEPCILFRLWNRKAWVFPWSYFIEAEYFSAANSSDCYSEQIRMVFGSREITLRGRNLVVLVDLVVRHRVVEIREVPEKFLEAGQADSAAPVVVSVEVKVREKSAAA